MTVWADKSMKEPWRNNILSDHRKGLHHRVQIVAPGLHENAGSGDRNPVFDTILQVLGALGLRVTVEPTFIFGAASQPSRSAEVQVIARKLGN